MLTALAKLNPNIVLLDIGLPGMDGYEVAAKLKQHEHLRGTRFIAISGLRERPQAGQLHGIFDHYLLEPVDFRALLALLETPAPAKEAEAEQPEPEESGPLRVLLVEDYPGMAATTEKLLRAEGLEVRTAATGREALEVAPEFRPHLILCDMNLLDMQGTEVIRELRSQRSTTLARAVIFTAMSQGEIAAYNKDAARLGVDEFVEKPIQPETIRTLASKLKNCRKGRA